MLINKNKETPDVLRRRFMKTHKTSETTHSFSNDLIRSGQVKTMTIEKHREKLRKKFKFDE